MIAVHGASPEAFCAIGLCIVPNLLGSFGEALGVFVKPPIMIKIVKIDFMPTKTNLFH